MASQNESTVYHLKLNNNQTVNHSYTEFVINDIEGAQVTYKTLVAWYYDLLFTNGKDKLVYNITLLGDGKGGTNEDADIQKTAIVEQNSKYLAGKTGYMIIEIRTKKDIRKNFWDRFNIRVVVLLLDIMLHQFQFLLLQDIMWLQLLLLLKTFILLLLK